MTLIREAAKAVPSAWLQFHGEETPEFCRDVSEELGRSYIRALRIPLESEPHGDKNLAQTPSELVEYSHQYNTAQAILLDAFVPGMAGAGKHSIGHSFLKTSTLTSCCLVDSHLQTWATQFAR
jgi:phosphoribosylanthranilate isomerase